MKILQINEVIDQKLLSEAFTHKSVKVRNKNIRDNERLEFLGDAVLELVVTEYLYNNYQNLKEGDLTVIRSALVKTESLAKEFKRLNLHNFIIMSQGEINTGGLKNISTLANFFESLLGVIYLSSGYQVVKDLIYRELIYKVEDVVAKQLHKNAKTQVQEMLQSLFKITPEYREISSYGPDHKKIFKMGLFVKDIMLTEGFGNSKHKAEEKAAKNFLQKADNYVAKIMDKL